MAQGRRAEVGQGQCQEKYRAEGGRRTKKHFYFFLVPPLFLNETDTKNVHSKEGEKIEGYDTILPKLTIVNPTIKIMCLVRSELANDIICREELMTADFPSIWLQSKNTTTTKGAIVHVTEVLLNDVGDVFYAPLKLLCQKQDKE